MTGGARSLAWAGCGLALSLGAGVLLAAPGASPPPTPPSTPGAAHPDGPLPGFTGGFGEPDCTACHEPAGSSGPPVILHLRGVPPAYCPGESYVLGVRVRRDGMESAGFQLTARRGEGGAAGSPAGDLRPAGSGVGVDRTGDPEVPYARQTLEGSRASGAAAEWRVEWIAPSRPVGPVLLHLAANAADGDGTEFGDAVETLEARSRPAEGAGAEACEADGGPALPS